MRLFRILDIKNNVTKVVKNELIADEIINAAAAMGDLVSAREASKRAFINYFAKFEEKTISELLATVFEISLIDFADIAFSNNEYTFARKYRFMRKMSKDEVVKYVLSKLHNSYLLIIYGSDNHVSKIYPFNTKREADEVKATYDCKTEIVFNNIMFARTL